MKILFVQKMNGISGSELYMLQIMPELKRRGYDPEMLIIYPVVGDRNKRFIEYLAEHGIPTHIIYGHRALSPVLFRKALRVLKKGNYDIVQTNLIHADTWMAMIKFLFLRKIKIVSVKHGFDNGYQAKYGYDLRHLKKIPYYWVEKFACRFIDFNITISKALYNVYVKGGITKEARIRNIYYGLTLKEPVDQSEQIVPPDGPFALIIGRLIPVKGHPFLIRAWKKVKAFHPELKLYIAGGGADEEMLKKIAMDEGLQDTVIFLGHVPNPHPLIEASRFTIVTSGWEGFGLILLESWLHKKPIVSFDAPAMNEVIDDKVNGLLTKFRDLDDLADKIIYFYKHPELAKQYGENGYHKLHSYYTVQRMTDETEQVYKAIYVGKPLQALN